MNYLSQNVYLADGFYNFHPSEKESILILAVSYIKDAALKIVGSFWRVLNSPVDPYQNN